MISTRVETRRRGRLLLLLPPHAVLELLLRLERGGEAVDELKLPRPLGVEQQLPVIVAVVVRVAVVCARASAGIESGEMARQ